MLRSRSIGKPCECGFYDKLDYSRHTVYTDDSDSHPHILLFGIYVADKINWQKFA